MSDAMMDARALARSEARDEYRRLLYVAMTRAAERLVVCGTRRQEQDGRTAAGTIWCENALQDDCISEPADDGSGEVWRYRKGPNRRSRAENNVPAATKPARTSHGSARRQLRHRSTARHHAVEPSRG